MSVRNCQKFKMSWLLTPNMASLQQGYFQNLSKSSGPGRSVNFAQLRILPDFIKIKPPAAYPDSTIRLNFIFCKETYINKFAYCNIKNLIYININKKCVLFGKILFK